MLLQDMLIIISSILIPTISFMGWAYLRLDKKISKLSDGINSRLNSIDDRLSSIEQRLSRLEGSFEERGKWEGKLYTVQKNVIQEQK